VGHAGFVLRESFIAFLVTASVSELVRAREDGAARTWGMAGFLWGLGWTTKLTFFFMLPVALFFARRDKKTFLAFVLGAALPILPFAIRNVSLGVPPLQMSATSLQIIAHRNMRGYVGAGERVGMHNEIRKILDASDETSLGVLRAAIASHEHPATDYPAQLGRKLLFFFAPVDFWNNISVTWLGRLSPFLALCIVWWGVLSPWATVGIALNLRRNRAYPLIAAFLALGVAPALIGGVYTRYRLVIEPIACCFFAAAIVEAARRIRTRGSLASGVLIIACAVALRVGTELATNAVFGGPQAPITKELLVGYVNGTFPPDGRNWLISRALRSSGP
jgi:hypothetical protein